MEVKCDGCSGTGKVRCKYCDRGLIKDNYDNEILCDKCGGIPVTTCIKCNGSGKWNTENDD